MPQIVIKRIHEPAAAEDGYRVLVDRLWPRGISKQRAALDRWGKELAPSTELRKWFGHQAGRWDEFQVCYRHELDARGDELRRFVDSIETDRLTLLYAAKNPDRNHALVLKACLERLL